MSAPVELPPEARALVLATLAKKVAGEEKLIRATFSGTYLAGSKQTFHSPLDDSPLGYVQRTDPKPEWRIVDEDALRDHLAAEYPGTVVRFVSFAVPGVGLVELDPADELYQVLSEHAPHLLVVQERVPEHHLAAALEQSKATGIAAAPGITRIRPGGQIRVVPDKDAAAAVQRLVAAGRLDWAQLALGADPARPTEEATARAEADLNVMLGPDWRDRMAAS